MIPTLSPLTGVTAALLGWTLPALEDRLGLGLLLQQARAVPCGAVLTALGSGLHGLLA